MSAATKPVNGITIEKYLYPNARSTPGNVFEIPGNSIVLVSEDVVDKKAMTKDGITLKQLGIRYRLMSHDLKSEKASYIVPMTIIDVSKKRGKDVAGIQLPIGKLIFDHGIYLKYSPGIEELGVNDRGDIMLRQRLESDPTVGPIINSVNTIITGRADRLVTRVEREENQRDPEEANAWLEAFELLTGRETLVSRFMCAGIEYTHRGNVAYLARTTHMNFFNIGDPEMMEIHNKVKALFNELGRSLPTVTITSLVGLPRNKMEFDQIQAELRKMGIDPQGLGLPKEFSGSNFYYRKTGSIVPANFVLFAHLNKLPDKINIITINTDYHGEVKSRGVLSPLMAIMSLIGVISAHCGTAILNRRGTATSFTGPTGTGKTTAGAFWAEKNERYRREELRRRYRIILKKEDHERSDAEIEEKVKSVVEKVGVLCQEDWVEIAKEGSEWVFWPTEKLMYARTGGFPGLRFILMENEPLLENAAADFGASGKDFNLGRVTHDYFPERIFYDPSWGHLLYDCSPRKITAHVFLERNPALDFIIKRVSAEEAIRWLLIGRTPQGTFEPLYNAYPDFSGLLIEKGIIGEKLVQAYEEAKKGNFEPIGGGDAEIGGSIFEKLDIQIQLWRKSCSDIPTYIVNGAPGLEITQDANWLLSESPEAFEGWKHVPVKEFQEYMEKEFAVRYDKNGRWSHIDEKTRTGEATDEDATSD